MSTDDKSASFPDLSINNPMNFDLEVDPEAVLQQVFVDKQIHSGRFEITFVSVEDIQSLHKEYMDDPTSTDIITFNLGTHDEIDADIYICPQVAKAHAEQFGVPYRNEIQLLLIHGVLHCLGYDDMSTEDKIVMDAEQDRILRTLV